MKNSIRFIFLPLLILAVAGFTSCTKSVLENAIGTAEFSLEFPGGESQLKSTTADSTVITYQLMISVEDLKGNAIFTDKLIPLYTFGTSFISAKLEIKTGEFRLTKFMVMNPSGQIVYASPKAGSPLAYLTNRPLPVVFNIYPDKVTTLVPEVLVVGTQTPAQFGYATFGVQVIKPLEFYTMCVLENPNPMIMAPIQITNAKLTISDNKGWLYTFELAATLNHLVIRGGSDNYTFLIQKDNYTSPRLQFTAKQLLAATKENPLVLKIPTGTSNVQVMYFQPTPEQGKDAMISNLEPDKNFGGHKYFEATYMSETQLTVMRSNRSLIWFDLSTLPKPVMIKKVILRLSYDLPVPWDSTIFVTSSTGSILKPAGVLQQIVEPWEENGVTWNKAPKTIEMNQVFISPFIRNTNIIEVDVTGLFVSSAANALANHGMLFRLNSEGAFKGFRFASSDFPEPNMRPKLSVQYTVAK